MLTDLSRETLPQQIAGHLMEFIRVQDLKPGEILPSEIKLSEDFGVSRPVVREALKSLAGQGIIEIVSGKGAIIKPVDNKLLNLFFQRAIQIEQTAAQELKEVRRPLEIQSARLAAQRRTEVDLREMARLVKAMGAQQDHQEHYADLDLEFHLQVALAAHNRMLYHLISSIRLSLKTNLSRPETLECVQELHEEIFGAIERQDAAAAGAAMARHFEGSI